MVFSWTIFPCMVGTTSPHPGEPGNVQVFDSAQELVVQGMGQQVNNLKLMHGITMNVFWTTTSSG